MARTNIKDDITLFKYDGTDSIYMVHDRVQWWAIVNTVMNLWVSQNWGVFLNQVNEYLRFRKGIFCFMTITLTAYVLSR